ncbi:hypothetical protein [Flavobacterium sp. NRK F7]|uniref:hypothetical protein n=1 Tax=Flavobacterium sp. NRK F7 TaxID=2954930 RepID=UPI0020903381|nr:hypothetical protein [Flavobacterium sp. NRK F7]MCO6161752.1 hypothetical protein [Flavobacterium sp. NRK F7]
MSTNPQDQEIDLGQILKNIRAFFESILDSLFEFILFLKKNSIIIIILLVLGFGLGYLLDIKNKSYKHSIIVAPNFGSADYLYAKVNLLNSKKKEDDTVFFNSIGIKDIKHFNKIDIEPIIDVYKFIDYKKENFELIKLMAQDGDIEEIIHDDVTSKNYPFHVINLKTSDTVNYKSTVLPILQFVNDSPYFETVRKQSLENINEKMVANDSLISQINFLLDAFSSTSSNNQKSDKLVYYNENNQLNDIIKTKENLIIEQGINRINLINSDKIVKEISSVLNIKNFEGTNNKMKFILPFILLLSFFLLFKTRKIYKEQIAKRS